MKPSLQRFRIFLVACLATTGIIRADISFPQVGDDPTSPRLRLSVQRTAEVIIDYVGTLNSGETLLWEKDADGSARIPAYGVRSLRLYPIEYGDTGIYQPVVVSATGTRRGQIARIEVLPAGVITNISARLLLTASGPPPIFGFAIAGGERGRRIVYRAIGPGLSSFGVRSPGSVQELIISDSKGNIVARRRATDRFSDLGFLNEFYSQLVGAFPAMAGDVIDGPNLPPGVYTMTVIPATPGEVLIELYTPEPSR